MLFRVGRYVMLPTTPDSEYLASGAFLAKGTTDRADNCSNKPAFAKSATRLREQIHRKQLKNKQGCQFGFKREEVFAIPSFRI